MSMLDIVLVTIPRKIKKRPLLHGKEKIMKTKPMPSTEKTFACETCQMRKKAEANPKALMSRLWRWHTNWCPGWKAYQAHLASQNSGTAST